MWMEQGCLRLLVVLAISAMASRRFSSNITLPNGVDFGPFAGGGLGYFKVFNTSGVGLNNLDVEDSIGPAFQIGFDYMSRDK